MKIVRKGGISIAEKQSDTSSKQQIFRKSLWNTIKLILYYGTASTNWNYETDVKNWLIDGITFNTNHGHQPCGLTGTNTSH